MHSKFDCEIAREEIADFIPSHNDMVDALPPEILEASYRPSFADSLFAFGRSLITS